MSEHLQKAFEQAKKLYPHTWAEGLETGETRGWQLVDAVAASFRTPERAGMLVLQEHRPGCRTPFNHWGFMATKQEQEPPRESNPLGLFCLECQAFCVLSEDGKRWLCPNGHD